MPPNRKKKKATANPARGFATTSIASKQNFKSAKDIGEGSELDLQHVQMSMTKSEKAATCSEQSEKEQPDEMSPEEFEAQLEMTELQNFLEKYGEKCQRETSRQVSKLRTEKRLMRAQADFLSTSQWLPSEIMQQILDYVCAKSTQVLNRSGLSVASDSRELSDDDVLIRYWKLFSTLSQLGFSYEEVMEAFCYLLKLQFFSGFPPIDVPKEGFWGLDDCLHWLALKSSCGDKPDYETQIQFPATADFVRVKGSEVDTGGGESYNNSANTDTGRLTPTVDIEVNSFEDKQEAPSTESESSSDMEPEQMLQKYLEYQSRLYKLDPNLVVAQTAKSSKKPKSKTQPSDYIAKDTSKQKAARLQAKIAQIKSDILFDHQEADERWTEMRVQLSKEAILRHRLDITDTEASVQYEDGKFLEQSEQKEDESFSMVGDLFNSLPYLSSSPTTGRSTMSSTDADSSRVQIRDFGRWSGVAPRRVLEEACKARDPTAKVMYETLSRSTFSCRHAATVQWSQPQQNILASPFDSVLCVKDPSDCTKVEMVSVSCPDMGQSEAFVSTIALFVIFAMSPKEEKTYMRLPSAWRDLWAEMIQNKKLEDDASDRQTLRSIRDLIAQNKAENVSESQSASDKAIIPMDGYMAAEILPSNEGLTSSNALKAIWSQKSSTPSYQGMLSARKTLPIWQYRNDILNAIEGHQVVIVCGQTGCGKSTQVPAYIMENEFSGGRSCRIYCTEPRRISAVSLARRVGEELGEKKSDVGTNHSLVGFAIRLGSQVTPQNRLVYATTGIVMRMLEGSGDLGGITHLVLDEVHERSIESDYLLIVLRKLLMRRPGLKVILMSATVDAQKFSTYLVQAPIFEVPGRTFPVETMYLEDAIETAKYTFNESGASTVEVDTDEEEEDNASYLSAGAIDSLATYKPQTRMTLSQMNEYRIPYDLVVKLLVNLRTGAFAEYSKAILIFLPGLAEIRRLHDMLISHHSIPRQYEVYALHSTIATEDQERAFVVPPHGMRKIVLATNIAETGITIPDITCVIDTGKHKEMRFDERRQLSRLIEAFISQANALQRRGRAGRVQKGLCFHLFTKERFQRMPKEQTPEMLRLSLQDLALRVKICKLGGIEETLSEALDPPSTKNIRRAIDALQDVKALTSNQELTALGRQLARLPLDVFLGKLLLLGTTFGCLDAALTIAAILSSKSPFTAAMGSRSQVDMARLSFKRGDSDLLTVYNAFSMWRRVCSTTGLSEQNFCRKNFLNIQTLSHIEDLKGQLLNSLMEASLVSLSVDEKLTVNKGHHSHVRRVFVEVPPRYNSNNKNDLVVKSIIAMSFYPKLLKREGKGWRNVANNQNVSLHPTSVNKASEHPPKWLSFYHIMQSSSKFYNAYETSAVEDMAVVLLCGEAEFRMYAGVMIIDGNRIRFSVKDWKTMVVLKTLRAEIKTLTDQAFRHPGKALTEEQQKWMNIWRKLCTKDENANAG